MFMGEPQKESNLNLEIIWSYE